MALACQKNSYLKELSTKVKSCEAGQLSLVTNGKKEKLSGYEVILEDTVLFPEGGGQPDDRGTINDIEVLRVTRRGEEAVHFLPAPLDPGSEVKVVVNWERRWDNMQQHSGQHLVTAMVDTHFGFPTTSWYLGERVSFIELGTPTISQEQCEEIERRANEKICQGVKMYPTLYENTEDPALKTFRTRGLPDDHVGAVRVVTIEGIEDDLCCGTHVSSLAHLQAVKVLGAEKGKKGKVNLQFLVGNRVLEWVSRSYEKDKALTTYLKGGPDQHIELLDKLQKSFKVANRNATTLLREVAVLETKLYKMDPNRDPVFSIHKREGDFDFMNIVVNELGDQAGFVFVTTGEDNGAGMFMLSGPEDTVAGVGPRVAAILDGKGAGKKGRFQGKVNKLQKRGEAEKMIREHLASSS